MKIPAHLAKELLETNFANVCAKLTAGGTLTTAEAKMLAEHASRPDAAPLPPEAAAPVQPEAAPETPPPAAGEATATQIAHWETIYETKRRQLYRYISTGREKGYECPLDQPARMPEWWARCMKQRVPVNILAAASRAARETGAAPESPAPAPETTAITLTEGSFDFPDQVERLRQEQRRIQHQLDKARAGAVADGVLVVSQTDCESLLRQSLSLTAELRKAENDLNDWLVTRGALSDTATVRSENARIAGAIYGAVRRLVRSVRPLLTGKSDAEQDRLWDAKTLECFSALKAAKFTVEIPAETA